LLISKRLAKEVLLIPNSRTAQKIIGSTHSKKEDQALQKNVKRDALNNPKRNNGVKPTLLTTW